MFQFGIVSVNLIHIVFAAIYIVSVGLFSVNKILAKYPGNKTEDKDHCREIIIKDSSDSDTDSDFHYFDYFRKTDEVKLIQYQTYNSVPQFSHQKIPENSFGLKSSPRAPPVI